MQTATIDHIVVDDRGVARIDGSRIKVVHLVMDKLAHDWTPEQIREQYPRLSLGQVYAALAYYYDHQAEIDAQIAASAAFADEARMEAGPSPVVERLRAAGRLE